MPTRRGSIHLFRLFGIDVYLHWAWFLAAVYFIEGAKGYSSPVWSVLECLSLFLIVLTHEFGHQLACRQVGGRTSQIVLWPLGGVAYVSPPQRPGAQLWTIAAGPLVNVVLFPLLTLLWYLARKAGWAMTISNLYLFIFSVWQINLGLLIFNMLPIYPLDGGQILRSLLWFVFGRADSLMIAACLGFAGVAAIGIWVAVLYTHGFGSNALWIAMLDAYIGMSCWNGFRYARALSRLSKAPRRYGFACPSCHQAPPLGEYWICGRCRKPFDTFATGAVCPHCGTQFGATACFECGSLRPISEWETGQPAPPVI